MSPYEILQPGGSVEYMNEEPGAVLVAAPDRGLSPARLDQPRAAGRVAVPPEHRHHPPADGRQDVPADRAGAGTNHAPVVEVALRQRVLPRPRAAEAVLHRAPVFAGIVRARVAAILAHCCGIASFHDFSFVSLPLACTLRARRSLIQRRLVVALLLRGALVCRGAVCVAPARGWPAAAVTTEDQPAFSLEVKAPDSVRDTLERHLDLQRFRRCPDLQNEELRRLLGAADANARELLATLGYSAPTIDRGAARAPGSSRRAPSPSPWSPGRKRSFARRDIRLTGRWPRPPEAPRRQQQRVAAQLVAARRAAPSRKAPGQTRRQRAAPTASAPLPRPPALPTAAPRWMPTPTKPSWP